MSAGPLTPPYFPPVMSLVAGVLRECVRVVCTVDVHRTCADICHDVSESQSECSGTGCRVMMTVWMQHNTRRCVYTTARQCEQHLDVCSVVICLKNVFIIMKFIIMDFLSTGKHRSILFSQFSVLLLTKVVICPDALWGDCHVPRVVRLSGYLVFQDYVHKVD